MDFFKANWICMFQSEATCVCCDQISPHGRRHLIFLPLLCSAGPLRVSALALVSCLLEGKPHHSEVKCNTSGMEACDLHKGKKKEKEESPSAAICYAKRICAPRMKHWSLSGFTKARPDGGAELWRFRHTCAFIYGSGGRSAFEHRQI